MHFPSVLSLEHGPSKTEQCGSTFAAQPSEVMTTPGILPSTIRQATPDHLVERPDQVPSIIGNSDSVSPQPPQNQPCSSATLAAARPASRVPIRTNDITTAKQAKPTITPSTPPVSSAASTTQISTLAGAST